MITLIPTIFASTSALVVPGVLYYSCQFKDRIMHQNPNCVNRELNRIKNQNLEETVFRFFFSDDKVF